MGVKAISPVIATLILIAIAVIAGVFVLRQFILLSTTSGQQNMIQIQDAVLYRTLKDFTLPNGTAITQMEVTLQINIKNIGQRVVTLTNITVDDYPVEGFTQVSLNPGQTYSGTYAVVIEGSTKFPYKPEWDSGTEHVVKVYYQVLGQPSIQVESTKATVQ